jgi:hypothetical protein
MIRFKRGRLPRGMRAFAHRDDGGIVVWLSPGLSARERLAAIREVLRAAPAAGWRSPRSPVLLPALAGCAGLRRAPESRRFYRAAAAAAMVAALAVALPLTAISVRLGGPGQQAAVQPGGPLLTGPGARSGRPAAGGGPGTGRQHRSGQGPPPAKPGPARTTPAAAGAPAPQATGTPAPVPGKSPAGRPSPSRAPAPSPSPSPARQDGSGGCVGLLGVTVCL